MSGNEIIFNDPKHLTPHTSRHRLFAGVRLEYTVTSSEERITSTFGRPLKEKLTVRVIHKKHVELHKGFVDYSYMVPVHPFGNTLSNAIYSKVEPDPYDHPHHTHHSHYSGNSVHRLQPTVAPTPESPYRWELAPWTECDQQCTGKKRRTAICVDAEAQQQVSPDYCNQSVKPQDEFESCNTECHF